MIGFLELFGRSISEWLWVVSCSKFHLDRMLDEKNLPSTCGVKTPINQFHTPTRSSIWLGDSGSAAAMSGFNDQQRSQLQARLSIINSVSMLKISSQMFGKRVGKRDEMRNFEVGREWWDPWNPTEMRYTWTTLGVWRLTVIGFLSCPGRGS